MEAQMPLTNTKDNSDASVPTKSINDLAQDVKQLLNEWNFPDAETVYFDKTTGDFVINGKHRSSNGKGYRAITHAAATLALMKFCQENQRAHPGFVLLDSPLLAYEKPEDEQDDLTNTDVNKKFFDSVYKWRSRQIIIFENKKSIPEEYETGKSITQFTKSSTGRYGFFPV